MFSSKWLTLYQYLSRQLPQLPAEETFTETLSDKLTFLIEQFASHNAHAQSHAQAKAQQHDWLEHEAFTAVLCEHVQELTFTDSELGFLFESFMAAQLCQLALVALNTHKAVMPENLYHSRIGTVYQKLGDYDMAKNSFEAALQGNADDAPLLCLLGFNYLYQGQAEQATHYFEQSTVVDPDFAAGYQNLAGMHYQDSEFAKAAEWAEKAFVKDTSIASTYITAVSSYLALGEFAKADAWINAAFEYQVSSLELVRLAGITAHKNGRPEEALDALNHYLSHHTESYDVVNIRAHILAELNMYEALEADLHQLRVFEPHDTWSLEQLFLCYFHTERWAEAQAIMVQLNRLAAHYKITYREQLNTINRKLSLDVVELS